MAADPRGRTFVAAPFAGARGLIIAPFQFETTADDNLRIESANALTGVEIAIQGRRRTADGSIEPFAFTHTPNTDRTVKTQDYNLGAGALLNLTIFASSGTPTRGQTFVTARFIRGLTGATIVLGTLLQGYVTPTRHLAYPGSPIEVSTDGDGYTRQFFGTVPGLGNECSETCPTGARWELVGFRAVLQTDGTVANRRSGIFLDDGATSYFRSPQTADVTASSLAVMYWQQGPWFNPSIRTDVPIAPLPQRLIMLAGHRVRTASNNLQAGDQYAAPTVIIREWLEG